MSVTPAHDHQPTGTRQDTRQRLIDATLALIDERGWPEVALADVARSCHVTAPACYKHFPSKSSLFAAALHQLSANLGERARTLLNEDPLESLLAIGLLLVELAENHPHLFDFHQLSPPAITAVEDPASRHVLLSVTRREVERLAAQKGADPQRLHLAIWSCLQGYTRLIAAGATTADHDFMRATLRAVTTIGDHS